MSQDIRSFFFGGARKTTTTTMANGGSKIAKDFALKTPEKKANGKVASSSKSPNKEKLQGKPTRGPIILSSSDESDFEDPIPSAHRKPAPKKKASEKSSEPITKGKKSKTTVEKPKLTVQKSKTVVAQRRSIAEQLKPVVEFTSDDVEKEKATTSSSSKSPAKSPPPIVANEPVEMDDDEFAATKAKTQNGFKTIKAKGEVAKKQKRDWSPPIKNVRPIPNHPIDLLATKKKSTADKTRKDSSKQAVESKTKNGDSKAAKKSKRDYSPPIKNMRPIPNHPIDLLATKKKSTTGVTKRVRQASVTSGSIDERPPESKKSKATMETLTHMGITKPVVECRTNGKFMEELAKAHEDVKTPTVVPASQDSTPKKTKTNGEASASPSRLTRSASKQLSIRSDEDMFNVATPEKSQKTPTKLFEMPAPRARSPIKPSPPKKVVNCVSTSSKKPASPQKQQPAPAPPSVPLAVPWVDKYKPTSSKQILGQQGEKSCMKKLTHWLENWRQWHVTGEKQKKFGKGAADDGSSYKAALLSGPPGIGKTTTADVLCKELGFNILALNASDARNKKSLEKIANGHLKDGMDDLRSFGFDTSKKGIPNRGRTVVIMDEVDGMSGTEDRSGVAELIGLIKSTRFPIICICNDRHHQKIRSLANYCFDLRFHRPQLQQLRGGVMSILFKEKIKMPAMMVDQIIESCGKDIRQVLNHLNFLSASGKGIQNLDDAKNAVLTSQTAKKDETVNVFDAVQKLFSGYDEQMTMNERVELFFSDYDLIPMFVHENYLNVEPAKTKTQIECLDKFAQAAEMIAMGDVIDRQIRSEGNWQLLNQKAMFSTVIPCEVVKGRMHGKIAFPSWFGRYSKHNKMRRLAQQLHMHTACKVSGNGSSWTMEYAPALRQRLVDPLLSPTASTDGGVGRVLLTLDAYDLTMEDREFILELTKWPDQADSTAGVQSKVKAALTRAYNKQEHKHKYAEEQIVKKKGGKAVKRKEAKLDQKLDEEMGEQEEEAMDEDGIEENFID